MSIQDGLAAVIQHNEVGGDLTVIINQHIGNQPPAANKPPRHEIAAIAAAFREEESRLARHLNSEEILPNGLLIGGGGAATPQETDLAKLAAVDALSSIAVGDEILRFETEPFRESIVEFLYSTSGFIDEVRASGRALTLLELPRALQLWQEQNRLSTTGTELDYLRAVALFLSCQFARAYTVAAPLAEKHPEQILLQCLAAEAALNTGRFKAAEKHIRRAQPLQTGASDEDHMRGALLASNLGACCEELLRSDEAIRFYQDALSLLPSSHETILEKLIRALILNNLGYSLMTISNASPDDTNLEQAEAYFRAALALREECDDTIPNRAAVLFNLAEVRRKLSDPGQASFLLNRAEGLIRAIDGEHALLASVENTRGKIFFARDDYPNALVHFEAARTTLSKYFGEKSFNIAMTTYSIAQTLEAMGSPEARSHLEHARDLALEILDVPSHPFIQMIEGDLHHAPSKRSRWRLILDKLTSRFFT